MKNKIFIIFCLLLTTVGCNLEKKETKTEKIKNEEPNITESEPIEEPKEEYPIEIGLYIYESGRRTLVKEISGHYPDAKDIVSLEVYCTKEETLPALSQKELWEKYCGKYEKINEYKIGYNISYTTTENKEVSNTIIHPNDSGPIAYDILTYLYDDIHQTTNWYSHVAPEDVKEDTIYTSIKLTGSAKIDTVKSPIIVKSFIYKEKELDNDKNYIGNNFYEMKIIKEN